MVCGLEEINEELGRIGKCRLRVEERPGRGRGLFAQQDLAAGQEVLAEQPLAFCLLQEHVSTRCDYTLRAPAGKLLRCSKSKVARYSSREAQAKAWKDYYRSECEALVKLKPRVPGTTARLVARMYWRRERDLLRWNIVSEHENHWPSFSDARKIELTQTASVVKALLEEEDAAVDLKGICMTLARVACNAHTICDDELKPVAAGVYPVASFTNHSCEPNCVQVYRGREILYKCLRPVACGEELTISYVDLCSLESERRDILRKNYFFDIRPSPPPPPPPKEEEEEEEISDKKQSTRMIASGGGAIEFPVELFTSAGLGCRNAATAAPSSLVSEEESPFVSICLKCSGGSDAPGEEIGKAFVVANQDTTTSSSSSSDHHDQEQEAKPKPSSPIHHLGTCSLSDAMGEEEVKVVCSFKFEEEEERAANFAKAVGSFLGRTHRVLLQSERLANENKFEEAYSSLTEILELCSQGVPVNNVDCER